MLKSRVLLWFDPSMYSHTTSVIDWLHMESSGMTFWYQKKKRYLNACLWLWERVEESNSERLSESYINATLHESVISSAQQQKQGSMVHRSKVGLHFSKINADDVRCNICDAKSKAGQGNTSKLRNHLLKKKIYLKANDCTIFDSLKANANCEFRPKASKSPAGALVPGIALPAF